MSVKKLITLHKQKQERLLAGSALDPFNHPSYNQTKRIKQLKAQADYERELHELRKKYFNV